MRGAWRGEDFMYSLCVITEISTRNIILPFINNLAELVEQRIG